MAKRPGAVVSSYWKWLVPGMGVKRWVALMLAGVLVGSLGLALLIDARILGSLESWFFGLLGVIPGTGAEGRQALAFVAGLAMVVLGAAGAVVGFRYLIRSIITAVIGASDVWRVVDLVYQRRQLNRGPRVVALGGGTGLSTLLRGLKEYTSNITAIVTVADDGGSSGRLRSEMGILPPGDIRNCLAALADTEPLMESLFQYRFRTGEGLKGHSFGNLFIAAMTGVTGDFERAVRESSKVLAVRGQVLPATPRLVTLSAELADGSTVRGETGVTRVGRAIRRVFLEPHDAEPTAAALEAIEKADLIILGPGSLFTSIVPNLLVKGIAQAIANVQAPVVYICNVMTQPGETDSFTAAKHVETVLYYLGAKENRLDYVILNSQPVPPDLLARYQAQGAEPVEADVERIKALGCDVILSDVASYQDMARHDPSRLAAVVVGLVGPGRRRRGSLGGAFKRSRGSRRGIL